MAEPWDAIVIGAGMSGLAAAIRVGLAGRSVCLLERHSVPGGLNSYYTLGGRPFDVGLHALTNYVPPGTRGAPLTRILRQLRIRHEELRLGEQRYSEIVFPGLRLTFTNDITHLQEQVERHFPGDAEGFRRLVERVREHRPAEIPVAADRRSARAVLGELLREPLLAEMLLCPVLYYGSAREDDVDWGQFCILFRSLFLEGLARPQGGIRTLVNLLVRRAKRAGVRLRYRAGVRALRPTGSGPVEVELENGEELTARFVLSSAGRVETLRLAGRVPPPREAGRLSFVETVSVLSDRPEDHGHGAATSFFCTAERLTYRRPEGLVDVRSGVVSAPSNFDATEPLPEASMRLTVLANHDAWDRLGVEDYARQKEIQADRAIASAAALFYDWRPSTVFRDVFTPTTIRRFTGHVNGAVYGSPRKAPSGDLGLPGIALCGTDQGYLGVIGALVSGIAMANRWVIAPDRRPLAL